MSAPRAAVSPSPRALALLFLAATGLGLAHVLAMRDELVARVPLGDAALFLEWASALRRGGWLAGDAFQAPLYAGFVALVQAACGPDPFWVRVAQAPVFALGCVLVAAGGARFVGPRAGLLGGWLCALHAPLVWSVALVQKPIVAFALGAAVLAALGAWAQRPRARVALLAGAALGLLAWTRQTALVLVPAALAWLLLARVSSPSARARLAHAGCLLAGFALASAPFVLRTRALTGELLPGTANLGVNLWIGNHAGADGLYQPLVAHHAHPAHEEREARVLASRALGHAASAREASRYWAGEAWRWARENPLEWLRLAGRKLALALTRAEAMDAEAYELHRERSRVLGVLGGLFDFGLLAPLAVLGLLRRALLARTGLARTGLARTRLARAASLRASWLLPAACALLLASLVATFVTARFRLALVPWAAPLAGAGVVVLLELAGARRLRVLAASSALLLALAALARVPLAQAGDPLATTRANLATALAQRGELEAAEREARAALARDPRETLALFALARVQLARGEDEAARATLAPLLGGEQALHARALVLLATAQGQRGNHARAAELFAEAARLAPLDALVLHDLGLAQRRSGRLAEAEASWRAALALDPALASAHQDLGLLLERSGRVDEALAHYEAACAADRAYVEPLAQLARIRAADPEPARRDGARAEELARRALALDGTQAPDLVDLLAAAQAERGDFAAARASAEQALAAARAQGLDELARAIETRLEAYRAGRAWRFER